MNFGRSREFIELEAKFDINTFIILYIIFIANFISWKS